MDLSLAVQVTWFLLVDEFLFDLGQTLIDFIKLWRFLAFIAAGLDCSNHIT